MDDPKNTGHRCNQLKQPTVKSLCENILETLKIKSQKDILQKTIYENCVLLEFLLRHAHFEKPTDEKNKFWFFDVFEPLTISQIMKEIKKNE